MLFFAILLLFSSFVSLYLRYIFCRQHIAVYCFFTKLDNLCLLNWGVYMITFNVIINMVRFESIILLFVFYLSHLFWVPLFLFCLPALGLIEYFL